MATWRRSMHQRSYLVAVIVKINGGGSPREWRSRLSIGLDLGKPHGQPSSSVPGSGPGKAGVLYNDIE